VYRLYSTDPVIKAGLFPIWGSVPPPRIALKDTRTGRFNYLTRCDTEMRDDLSTLVKDLAIMSDTHEDGGINLPETCPLTYSNINGEVTQDFFLKGNNGWEDQGIAERSFFVNGDSNYLYWCEAVKRLGKNFVIRVHGRLPRVPDGLFSGIKISDIDNYQSRYISISTVDLALPGNTYQSIYDAEIESFYKNIYDEEWNEYYTIVAAEDPDVAKACGLLDSKTEIFLPYQRPGTQPPEIASIFFRELVSSSIVKNERGQTVADVNNACTGIQNKKKCKSANFGKSIMNEYYPEIQILSCNPRNGQWRVMQ